MQYTDFINNTATLIIDNAVSEKEGTFVSNGELLHKLLNTLPNSSVSGLLALSFLALDMTADAIHLAVLRREGGEEVPRDFVFHEMLRCLDAVSVRLDAIAAATNQPAHTV